MSAHDLIRELEALPQDVGIHWKEIYDRIMEAAQTPNTEEERLILLSLLRIPILPAMYSDH
jgi:hypothetical protein